MLLNPEAAVGNVLATPFYNLTAGRVASPGRKFDFQILFVNFEKILISVNRMGIIQR